MLVGLLRLEPGRLERLMDAGCLVSAESPVTSAMVESTIMEAISGWMSS